jgi:hypothetical protein
MSANIVPAIFVDIHAAKVAVKLVAKLSHRRKLLILYSVSVCYLDWLDDLIV